MFFKERKNNDQVNNLTNIAALLVHAAKIDENYSDKVFITSLYFFKDKDIGLFLSLIYSSTSPASCPGAK